MDKEVEKVSSELLFEVLPEVPLDCLEPCIFSLDKDHLLIIPHEQKQKIYNYSKKFKNYKIVAELPRKDYIEYWKAIEITTSKILNQSQVDSNTKYFLLFGSRAPHAFIYEFKVNLDTFKGVSREVTRNYQLIGGLFTLLPFGFLIFFLC